jgi:cadmium resistance protein CadD (predicted permease)
MTAFSDFAAIVAVSATTFAATSLDNLLILVGFQTSNSVPTRSISLGFLAATTTMIGVALALAAAADEGLPFAVGYLGLAPIAIGIYHGVRAFRPDREEEEGADSASREGVARKRAVAGFASVFLTMLANSGDSLLVFTALIADTKRQADLGILATVLVMAAAWVWVARWLSGHPRFREPLRGFARFGLPILLIGVGLYILTDSPTDVVLRP